MAETGQLNPHG